MDIKLNTHVFLASANGSVASSWYPVDCLYTNQQERAIYVRKASAEVVIETKISALNSSVITTVTAITTANNQATLVITGPFTDIRARAITGTAATNWATVIGIV